jgi:nitrous oxidase accessory protein NosD
MNTLRVLVLLCLASPLVATTYSGTPANYTTLLAGLVAGDTLNLAGGTYANRLVINGLNGTSGAWITIEGPTTGTPATFNGVSGNNTVSLRNCSFIAIKNITIDCLGLAVDGIKAEGYTAPATNAVHDMLIEGCKIVNAGNNQQIVGINTKCPCWNWTIRGNEIIGAGTGLYLGNSTGDDPFVAGIIEGNRVYDPEGYCVEIKHQNPRPTGVGLPTGDSRTIIRNNVFIKTDRASGSGDRPNVLFGGFPDSGVGSNDLYEVYGNFFSHNPREVLLQATGRFTIHDNLFVDQTASFGGAILVTNHSSKAVKLANIYNNTTYATYRGIYFANAATADQVTGNLCFSATPIAGTITNQSNNVTATVAQAGTYVNSPSTTLGSMNFFPLAGQCTGAALNLAQFSSEDHYNLDFNGTNKGTYTYRGCYAGSGTNPGWQAGNTLKTGGPGSGPTTPPALAIASPAAGAVANATVGNSYAQTFSATGGTAPYSWSVTSGALPSGLTLNPSTGSVSGTPTTIENASFSLTVTDSAATPAVASRAFSLNVQAPGTGGTPGAGGGGGGGGCSAGENSLAAMILLALWFIAQTKRLGRSSRNRYSTGA